MQPMASVSRLARAIIVAPAIVLEPLMLGAQKLLGIKRMPWVFLIPNLLAVLLFSLLPVLINVYYSFTGSDRLFLSERPFVGTSNYSLLLECQNYLDPSSCKADLFWRAFRNTLVFVPVQVTCMVAVALLAAICLNRNLPGRGFFRGVFFFPVMLSPVVVALTWQWILQRNGALNGILGGFGLEPYSWLTYSGSAFFWAVFITVWAHMGFYTIILLAGLQAIPKDVYEAAKMDSASPFRMFRSITLPLLKPMLLVVFVLCVIRSVQTFDELYVLTGGGPGSATMLMVQYIYEIGFAVQPRNYGLATSASLLLGIVLMAVTALQFWLSRKTNNG